MRHPASHRSRLVVGARAMAVGLCLVVAGVVTGCAGPEGQANLPAASAAASLPTSPLEGQVVKVDSEGLTKVRGFVLRTDSGTEIAFAVGPLENAVEFPPSHLSEHMATGAPVRISFRQEGSSLVVYRIEDASGS